MSSRPDLKSLLDATAPKTQSLARLNAELEFAYRLSGAHADKTAEWDALLQQAASHVSAGIAIGTDADLLVQQAERLLAPLGEAAKQYTIYCAGHAHIDMNWMWSWPETVSVTYDTFATMDKLMDEFPEFHFSQSQASVYHLTDKYAPELFDRVKARVKEGRWEVTASQWVEGSKNLASGEILARHLLYTRRWLRDKLGLPYDACKVDWEPDTFGHCWTLPGILTRGGVTRYYHHRASGPRLASMTSGETSQLFWWEGKDGSRILAYDDSPNGYNCEIGPHMTRLLFDLERHTGLKMLLWVYGVGDHGGGPTRRHLRAAQDLATWPIFPNVKLTTTDDFFNHAEAEITAGNLDLPVHNFELNFVFEGCYTSQSWIKFANRKMENDLVDTEAVAYAVRNQCGITYPSAQIEECWQRAMFSQFHDILPGSGVHETREYCMGQLQENLATTTMIRTQGLRALAGKVNTAAVSPLPLKGVADMGLGAGVGDGAWWGGVSTVGAGEAGVDPFLVFNPAPFSRDELVLLKVWNRDLPDGNVIVRDSKGSVLTGQIVERGDYWGHRFAVVAVPAKAIPATGYTVLCVETGGAGVAGGAYAKELGRPIYGLSYVQAQMISPIAIGNEFLEAKICPRSGGIVSLIDKETGAQFVAPGKVLGAIEREQEAPHGMTAWQLAPIVASATVLENCILEVVHQGPNVSTVRLSGKHNESTYRLTISLASGSRELNFTLDVNWLERGDPATGVPALRATFPLALTSSKATFEIACGSIERPTDGEEVPALNWADLSGEVMACTDHVCTVHRMGAALLNDSKYGYQATENALRLTLLRSSFDPDPLPEMGAHQIRFALLPYTDAFDVSEITRAGYAFNHPLIPVGTTVHEGELPAETAGLEILTPNVMLSGVKKAEDADAVIIRLFEMTGETTRAQVRLSEMFALPNAAALEVDLLEQPLAHNTATVDGDVLSVDIPAFGIASVQVMRPLIGYNAI